MMQLTMGKKGEIVIPKKIRDQMGFSQERMVILDMKEKTIILRLPVEDIVKQCEEVAKKAKADVSKWIYGDKLYEEVF